jgi:hypothetical protein
MSTNIIMPTKEVVAIRTETELIGSLETSFIGINGEIYLITKNGIVNLSKQYVCNPTLHRVQRFVDLEIKVK